MTESLRSASAHVEPPAAAPGPDGAAPARARVLVNDDSPRFLTLLCGIVPCSERLGVVGEGNSGETAVQLTEELRPNMALIDVNMPGLGGIGAATRIRASWPSTTVVLVSSTPPELLDGLGSASSTDGR